MKFFLLLSQFSQHFILQVFFGLDLLLLNIKTTFMLPRIASSASKILTDTSLHSRMPSRVNSSFILVSSNLAWDKGTGLWLTLPPLFVGLGTAQSPSGLSSICTAGFSSTRAYMTHELVADTHIDIICNSQHTDSSRCVSTPNGQAAGSSAETFSVPECFRSFSKQRRVYISVYMVACLFVDASTFCVQTWTVSKSCLPEDSYNAPQAALIGSDPVHAVMRNNWKAVTVMYVFVAT